MKSNRWVIPVLLMAACCCLMLSACGGPPEAEIMAAEDAIKRAAAAGADESSPNLLEKAQGFLQDAKVLSEQGHYSEARKKADFARMRAEQAEKNASRLSKVEEKQGTEGVAEEAPPEGKVEGEAETK